MVQLTPSEDQQARREALDEVVANDKGLQFDIENLTRNVLAGRITFADVGGFSESELEGGYAAAVAKLESEQPAKAIKIIGTLLTLNPRVSKYYRLVGIALHRLKQYQLADAYYDIALAFDSEDPISMLYRGETHLLMNQRMSGRKLLEDGLKRTAGRPDLHAIAQRARAIAQAFGMPLHV